MLAWLILTVPTLGWLAYLLTIKPTREVLWITWWVTTLFVPHWTLYQLGFLALTSRAVCQGFVLLAFLASPGPGGYGFGRPVPMDLIQALFVSANLVSEFKVGRFSPLVTPEILRIWLLPYLFGRLFLRDADDLRRCMPTFANIGGAACVYAIVESLVKINVVNKLLGKTFGLLESGEGYRMGMKRCQGAQDHPIFMGMVLLLMLPWAFEASRQARAGLGPKWWKRLPWLIGGALFGSVSRGAQIAGIVTTFIAVFIRNPKKRVLLLILAIVFGLIVQAGQEALLSVSAAMSNETVEVAKTIVINGEEEEYTGTRHRVLLFKAYGEYLEKAGMWGFGNAMKAVQLEESLAMRFSSIDSTWVMLFLQRGYSGVVPLGCLLTLSALNALWVGWPMRKPHAAFCGAMFGSILTFAFALLTTWFSPDFGSFYLFTAGVCARLPYLKWTPEAKVGAEAPAPSASVEAPSEPRRLLVPGHPPARPFEISS